jgi:CHAT domain-containing protein
MKAPAKLATASLLGMSVAWCASQEWQEPTNPLTRLVEARLSLGEGAYVRCRSNPWAGDLIPDAICGDAYPVARASKQDGPPVRGASAEAAYDVENPAQLGGLLQSGSADALNRAVRRLEISAAAHPEDAQAWSDLAAVYMTRAQRLDNPRDLLRSYEAADHAVRTDGSILKARFNQALALERLYLWPAASNAWKEYLDRDKSSDWAQEAKERRQRLDRSSKVEVWDTQRALLEQAALRGDDEGVRKIVDRNRQSAREYAEYKLFGLWADAEAAGDARLAADRLTVLRAIGDALAGINDERMVQHAVSVIDAVWAKGDPAHRAEMIEACRKFRDGYDSYVARDIPKARPNLREAFRTLSKLGSPLALRAEVCLIGIDFIEKSFLRAGQDIARFVRALQGAPYAALRGQALRVQAVVEGTQGQMSSAIEHYEQSIRAYEELGEAENRAAVECLLGEVLTMVGRGQEAWSHIYAALTTTPKLRDQNALINVYMIAAGAAFRDGHNAAALAFQEERVRQVKRDNDLGAVEALSGLAKSQNRAGQRDAALASLRAAESHLQRLDEKTRKQKQADLDMIQGTIMAGDEPATAIDLLSRALAVHRGDHNKVFSLWTLLPRAQAYRQTGDLARAEQDMKEALSVYSQMGDNLKSECRRLALLQQMDAIFDEMVALQYERNPERAFAFADQAHTQVLPGSASKLWTEPETLPMAEIRQRLPKGVTLVQYHVLDDRILIWVLANDSRTPGFFVQPIPRTELETRVARLLELKPETWEAEAAGLYDLLVRPWAPGVPAQGRIVLVPDKVLQLVPFMALRNRVTDKLLIEEHTLAFTPSATLHVNVLQRQGKASAPLNLANGLVVGEPAVNRTVYSDLPALEEARREAEQLAGITGSDLLSGAEADEKSFLDKARNAEWIHFAGHSLIDQANTLLSKLVLAPGPDGDSGELTAQEIYSFKLPKTRFVVLAACETGSQFVPGGEGVTSLARAFQSAGVPTVVASLWSVDDKSTAHLFKSFYDNLKQNPDPAEALAKAQRAMLRSMDKADRSPKAWAAFTVIDASAN